MSASQRLLFVSWSPAAALLTLAALAGSGEFAAAQSPPQANVLRRTTRQSQFSIPFTLDRRAEDVSEVRLFLSTDRGRTWRLADARPPAAGRFPFRAPDDGVYWFASRTVDKQQRMWPQQRLGPELEVRVDTSQPQLDLDATAVGEKVRVRWSAWDPSLDPASMKLEYRSAGGTWRTARIKPEQRQGQRIAGSAELPAAGSLELRAIAADQAGNRAVVSRQLGQRLAATPSPTDEVAAVARGAVPSDPLAGSSPDPEPSTERADSPAADSTAAVASAADEPSAAVDALADRQPWPPSPDPFRRQTRSFPPAPNLTAQADPPAADADGQQYKAVTSAVGPPVADRVSPSDADDDGWSAFPPTSNHAGKAPQPSEDFARYSSNSPGAAGRIDPRWTNRTRFSIDYEVNAITTEQVGSVELWATEDRGRTWSKWGDDPDRTSPLSIKIDREGVYGFHVVVVSEQGMASAAPRTSDDADVWVGVDVTPPECKVTGATYGQGPHAGRLDIRWTASDKHFGDRPVSLHYAPSAEGPWKPVASEMENSGRYLWLPNSDVPEQVYLRLTATDRAGNPADDLTTGPIKVDGLRPRGRIRALQPLNGEPPAATARAPDE